MIFYSEILFEDTKVVYVYRNGVYVPHGEDTIAKSVQDALGDASKKTHIAEVINYIQHETLIPRSQINHDTEHINLLNGVYNLHTDRLEEHTPDNISIVQIPVEYDPNATCPAIEKFISDVVDQNRIDVIYEFIGYCMIPDTRFEKAMMLIGKGANGKSVLLSLLGTLIGEDNTSHENLHALETDPYSVAELYGKLVNIFPDLASTAIYDNQTFKMLTGDEGKMRARQIYQPPFTFKNTCRLIFSANHVPPVPGNNYAYFRRWIPVVFPNQFEGDDADKNLIDKLTTPAELSGLFNLAVMGLKRLLAQNDYSFELTTSEIMKLYQINSDPIAVFADECVVYSDDYTLKSVMYNNYIDWCQTNDVEAAHENTFSKRFKKLGYVVGRESTGERRRTWESCSINYKSPESVRAEENSPDVKNRDDDTHPSGRPSSNPPLFVHKETCDDVHVNSPYMYNGAKVPSPRTDWSKNDNGSVEDIRPRRNANRTSPRTGQSLANDRVLNLIEVKEMLRVHVNERYDIPNVQDPAKEAFRFCALHNGQLPADVMESDVEQMIVKLNERGWSR